MAAIFSREVLAFLSGVGGEDSLLEAQGIFDPRPRADQNEAGGRAGGEVHDPATPGPVEEALMRKLASCVLFSALFLVAEKNAPQGNGLDWFIPTSDTTAGLRGVSAVDS